MNKLEQLLTHDAVNHLRAQKPDCWGVKFHLKLSNRNAVLNLKK